MASQPIIIVVVGPAGSGKTNFINQLTGTREERAAHQLKSHTQSVRKYTVNRSNRQYVFVDTPGFDHTYLPDQDILRVIAEWLEKQYRANAKLSGIIYTHRITDNRMSGSVCKNLGILARLCGRRATDGVRLVTTMWDKVKSVELAESRVSQLENNFWRPLIEEGARHKRFEENSSRCAWEIVQDLTGEGEALLVQEELVDARRDLNETTVGQAMYAQLRMLLHEQKETIKQLQEEAKAQRGPELVKQLEVEQRRLEAELQKTYEEMDKLKIPFSGRIALFFARNTPLDSITTECVTENDYVIFVVGPTGVGKTWFTKQLYKNHSKRRHPHTENIKAWRCNLGIGSGNIIVVDTPSFHSDRDDLDDENGMADWLKSKFTKKCHSGILFLHSLDSDPTSGDLSMSWHLGTFAKILRNKFTVPSDIYVVATCDPDSNLPSETLSQRLSQLKTVAEGLNGNGEHGWHVSMFPGVFKGQPETAWSAALLLLKGITQVRTKVFFASPRPALKRMPPKSPDAHLSLRSLADTLFKEFKKKESDRDLDAIIKLGQTALVLTPSEHPQRRSTLIDLADLVSERLNNERRKTDLDELITLKRAASECMSPDEPQRLTILLELDDHLFERFKRDDSTVDLEEIISLRRAALERILPPDRCRALLNLANALHEQGTENSVTEAVSLARTALGLCPPGNSDRALCQEYLASYLETKVGKKESSAHTRRPAAGPSSSGSFDIKRSIKKVVFDRLDKLPLRLLHTSTGVLCDRDAQISHFESSPQYQHLLSLASSLDNHQLETEINKVISEYFEYATLSHRWGNGEPLLRDVEGKSIYDLSGTDGQAKLQKFCIFALRHHFQWAWSDTCCIDKDSSAELQEAIGSMFSWYHWSSLTIVHLSDVFDAGSLAGSVWFTRGWTLQELLASRTVFFYTYDWSLYLKSDAVDHKADPALLEELQDATGIAKEHLTNFYPGMDDARSRLHWASSRRTTRPEDIAYSLFGIFQVHLPIFYGESAQNALGRLLAEIISRSGDVSVLDWVGKRSSFNSCFPVDLAPYKTVPHFQPVLSDPAGHSNMDLEKAQKLYTNLARLPRAGVVNSKLTLPSTVHPITAVKLEGSSTSPSHYTYEIHASRLRPINVALSVELDESVDTYILVRPWHPKLLEQQTRGVEAVWKLLEQLEQPFNALLLKRSLRNEYTRIASDCTIAAYMQDLDSILDSEVLTPEIV